MFSALSSPKISLISLLPLLPLLLISAFFVVLIMCITVQMKTQENAHKLCKICTIFYLTLYIYILFFKIVQLWSKILYYFISFLFVLSVSISNCPLDSLTRFFSSNAAPHGAYKQILLCATALFYLTHTHAQTHNPPLHTHKKTQAHMSTNTYPATPGHVPRCAHTHTKKNTHTTTWHTTSVKSLAD